MDTLLTPARRVCPPKYNRVACAFLLLAAIVLLILKDWQNGFCMLGISLIVAPFYNRYTPAKRPLWQRNWLIVHLTILFAAMLYLIISKL
nr:hypothetical protein [uncultured Mucilaginibacter sp.]